MGLTGFNRQRKRTLSADLEIDERLADKLLAYGYSTPDQVRSVGEFPFLSDEELAQLKGKNPEPVKSEGMNNPYPEPQEEKQSEGLESPEESDVAASDDLDEAFLALPQDTKFPYKIKGGWHYLSNGEKLNGKSKAEQAQAALDG